MMRGFSENIVDLMWDTMGHLGKIIAAVNHTAVLGLTEKQKGSFLDISPQKTTAWQIYQFTDEYSFSHLTKVLQLKVL